MDNKIILNQSHCFKKCNDVNCDAENPHSIFGSCDYDGTIKLKDLNEKSDKVLAILEIEISHVDFSLYVINQTIKKTMEFTVISKTGVKYEGSFSMAFQHRMSFPFIEGKFWYKLSMPSFDILKLDYKMEHECMFTKVQYIGKEQCAKEVYFENLHSSLAKHLKWHKGQIVVELDAREE